MHLLIDGFGGDVEKMNGVDFIYKFLDEYPSKIGMNKIHGPNVVNYDGGDEYDWGVSGFVMIAESHISIHTFPARSYVNIDVFSCKDFDDSKVIENIREIFSLEQMKVWVVGRGLNYSDPSFAGSVSRGWEQENIVRV